MRHLSESMLSTIGQDLDDREDLIRALVYEAMAEMPAAYLSEHVVATYFVMARSLTPFQVGKEICYHMTSGVRHPPANSLLAECTGQVIDAQDFDGSRRIGLVRVAFPLRMLLHEDGSVFSTDILHIAGGEGVFGLTEHSDIKLVDVEMSDEVLNKFPGPAYGPAGVREISGFTADEIAFGTILKPCTGLTPEDEAIIVAEAASNPLFMFIKEDENFLPGVPFAPFETRLRRAMGAVNEAASTRGGKGVIYAPHCSAPPDMVADYVRCAVDAGVNGIMFSEYYTGGCVRMVRELTKHLPHPPAIYGHNGGISCRTRQVYREVLDLFARLDGVDFRQTAPLTQTRGLLRPSGQEWRRCEDVLSRALGGHKPVMIARAGGLDQGNIIPNLMDVADKAGVGGYLFLAGSAINSVKDETGAYNPKLGAAAMQEALDVFKRGVFASSDEYSVAKLASHAQDRGLRALAIAIKQRYG